METVSATALYLLKTLTEVEKGQSKRLSLFCIIRQGPA